MMYNAMSIGAMNAGMAANTANANLMGLAESRQKLVMSPGMDWKTVAAVDSGMSLAQARNNTMAMIYEANAKALEKATAKGPRAVDYTA